MQTNSELRTLWAEYQKSQDSFITGFAGRLLGKRVDTGSYVPMLLFATVLRSVDAGRVLLEHGFSSEAGVVTLSLFESKLDLLYVGTDAQRGDQWLNHTDPVHQPWNVSDKIDAIYGSGTLERLRQKAIFQALSAVKHRNPISGPAGFPERRADDLWEVNTGGFDDDIDEAVSLAITLMAHEQAFESSVPFVVCWNDTACWTPK